MGRLDICQQGPRNTLVLACPTQQALDAQAVVQLGPVNAGAGAARSPMLGLSGRRLHQRWIPRQRHADCASVLEFHHERLGSDTDFFCFRAHEVHSSRLHDESLALRHHTRRRTVTQAQDREHKTGRRAHLRFFGAPHRRHRPKPVRSHLSAAQTPIAHPSRFRVSATTP